MTWKSLDCHTYNNLYNICLQNCEHAQCSSGVLVRLRGPRQQRSLPAYANTAARLPTLLQPVIRRGRSHEQGRRAWPIHLTASDRVRHLCAKSLPRVCTLSVRCQQDCVSQKTESSSSRHRRLCDRDPSHTHGALALFALAVLHFVSTHESQHNAAMHATRQQIHTCTQAQESQLMIYHNLSVFMTHSIVDEE